MSNQKHCDKCGGFLGKTEHNCKKVLLGGEKTRFKKSQVGRSGADNGMWKGGKAYYFTLHEWIYKTKGRPQICIACDSTKNLEWANISGEYKRDTNDFFSLCRKCHTLYDNKGWTGPRNSRGQFTKIQGVTNGTYLMA